MILSYAHEWAGNRSVVCIRCGHRCAIPDMKDAPRCKPHYESETSGWTGQKVERPIA